MQVSKGTGQLGICTFTNQSGCFTLHHQYRNSVASRTLSPLSFPVWRRTWTAYSMVSTTCRIPQSVIDSFLTVLPPFSVCDSSCLFTSSLSEVSRRESVQQMAENGGDNRFSLVTVSYRTPLYLPYPCSIQELSTLCPSASCMISCLSKSLNAACPPAGDDIIVSIYRIPFLPFETHSFSFREPFSVPSMCMQRCSRRTRT